MFKTLLAALAAATMTVPSAAQNVRFGITLGDPVSVYHPVTQWRGTHYIQCRRPNGRIGILTDYFGRPVTRYTVNYTKGLKCLKVTKTYDDRYGERYWGRGY